MRNGRAATPAAGSEGLSARAKAPALLVLREEPSDEDEDENELLDNWETALSASTDPAAASASDCPTWLADASDAADSTTTPATAEAMSSTCDVAS
eukprot:9748720-Lingulodinium_polyedra.AAC.1